MDNAWIPVTALLQIVSANHREAWLAKTKNFPDRCLDSAQARQTRSFRGLISVEIRAPVVKLQDVQIQV